MEKMEEKRCFVISPIGDEGGPQRKKADQLLNHIIKPIAKELGYTAYRSDDIGQPPGILTDQIVRELLESDIVIAYLADDNPNVFYELAIRHTARKPVIQIIDEEQTIPFDINNMRTIKITISDLDSVEECKEKLRKQIEACEKEPDSTRNPISISVEILNYKKSNNSTEKALGEIMETLRSMNASIAEFPREKSKGFDPLKGYGFDLMMPLIRTSENYIQITEEILQRNANKIDFIKDQETATQIDRLGSLRKRFIILRNRAMHSETLI